MVIEAEKVLDFSIKNKIFQVGIFFPFLRQKRSRKYYSENLVILMEKKARKSDKNWVIAEEEKFKKINRLFREWNSDRKLK